KADLMKLDNKMRGGFEGKFHSEEIMRHVSDLRRRNEDLNREVLREIEVDGGAAKAVTTKPPVGEREILLRYHIRMAEGGWKIFCIESVCMNCNGSSKITGALCCICGGTGWKDYALERFKE